MTKRFSLRIAAVALGVAVLAAGGCQKPNNPGQDPGPGGGTEPKGPYFKAELPDERVIAYNDGNVSWPVETDITDWTATSDAEWCKPTTAATYLRLDIEDYDCRDENGYERYDPPRTCTVTVKAGTVFSKTIKIIQVTHIIITFPQQEFNKLRYDWILSGPEGMTVLLSADGQTRDVVVKSNAYRWTPSTEADWLTVTRIDGATLRVTSKARDASVTTSRSATVKVDSGVWDQYATFTVKDATSELDDEGYGYGDHTDWD